MVIALDLGRRPKFEKCYLHLISYFNSNIKYRFMYL